MKRSVGVALVIGYLELLATTALAQPTASLSTWQATNGTGVRFVPLSPELVEQPSIELPDETSDGAYKYAVDTTSLSWSADCTCYRYYVVIVRATANTVLTRHKCKGIPSGSFVDQRAPVRLSITDGRGPHTDDIALPVASAPGLEPSPLIAIKSDTAIHSISVGGVTEIQVNVQNPNANEPMDIRNDVLLEPESRAIWKTPPALSDIALPLSLAPRATKSLTIRLEPSMKQAIGLSFPRTSQDVRHTTLRLTVPYASRTFSGRDRHIMVDIPLRFRPSLVTLQCGCSEGSSWVR
jgi:hypothetical protein